MCKVQALYRDGTHAGYRPAEDFLDGRIRYQATVMAACGRCGGAGGADKWRHTGWTCFECGGSGKRAKETTVRLYTPETLEKLNRAQAKAAETRRRKAEAAEAQRLSEAEARAQEFYATHGKLLERCKVYMERGVAPDFMVEVVNRSQEWCNLSDRQAEALERAVARLEAEDARRAAATWVGEIGQRLELTVTVLGTRRIETEWGGLVIVSMRDGDGNTLVYKGSRSYGMKPRGQYVIRGTVKDHGEFRGEPQTVLSRVQVREAIYQPEYVDYTHRA